MSAREKKPVNAPQTHLPPIDSCHIYIFSVAATAVELIFAFCLFVWVWVRSVFFFFVFLLYFTSILHNFSRSSSAAATAAAGVAYISIWPTGRAARQTLRVKERASESVTEMGHSEVAICATNLGSVSHLAGGKVAATVLHSSVAH